MVLAGGNTVAFSSETPEEKSVLAFVDSSTGELVVTNQVSSAYEIQLFDLTGKEVLKVAQEPESPICRIQTSHLRKGVYLVRVTPSPDAPSAILKVLLR
jgi:hypothetical protein